jgi:hypothetical protein
MHNWVEKASMFGAASRVLSRFTKREPPTVKAVRAAFEITVSVGRALDDTAAYKEVVKSLTEHLGAGSTVYRVATLISQQNRKFVRVSYTLYTQDQYLFELSRCYFARNAR